ncbi:MAG: hypothetical protein J1D85_08240 [Bacteroidales bacterium]|nr:hypothetical protein [Bacteroidales bacterium]
MNTSTKIKPMPLSERLQRLDKLRPAHPEFPKCAVQALAETPISVFLAGFKDARDELAYLLDIDIADLEQMNYAQLAASIHPFWLRRREYIIADNATSLLASPYIYIENLPRKGDGDERRKIVP